MQARMERNWMPFLVISLALFGINSDRTWAEDDRHGLLSPSALKMFVDELPDMPRISAFHVLDGVSLPKSLKIGMFHKKWKFHRDLPPTPVFAYGTSKTAATVPGPTIEALHGVDTYVTWKNQLPSKHILPWDPTIPTAMPRTKRGIPTVVHLHGGIDEPESDGHAYSWFTAGFKERGPSWTKKKYHYHNNQQPGNLWYHDHALGLTRVNLLAGLIGSYIIRHHAVEAPLGLPNGAEFDRPLVVFDRSFRTDGSIYMNATGNNPSIHPQWQPEYFGDAIIVNGKAWPHMIVKRRKYRFRIINASNARFFKFYFTNGLGFIHVGSDSAYNERPVKVKNVLLAPSEIADVVVDFSKSKPDRVILGNDAAYPYPSGDPVNEVNGKVMKFIIKPHRENDTCVVPNKLVKYPSSSSAAAASMARRYIGLYEYVSAVDEPINLKINGKTFEAPATEKPKVGSTEIWYVINLTEDNHPLHIHLGLFRVLEQTELLRAEEFKACMRKVNDAVKCQIRKYARGKKLAVVAHEKGWKNVYKTRPGYVTKILVRFSYIHTNASYPFDATAKPGYVYHCHVLNAAMLYWPMPNVLYVEGYALDRFAEGLWALQPVHQNRVGLVLDGGIEQELLLRHLQVVDATRASLGLPVVEYVVTDTPLQVEKWVDQKSQQSTGRIKHPDSLLRAVQTLIDRSIVNAIAVVARFPDDDTEDIDDYRQGMGIDHLAGAEAVISHLVVKNFGIPCAHAPALSPLSLSMSLCPKSAAEEIGYTFLPCVLAGLSNAPQYMVNKSESLERGCILATDVDSVILPLDACGGDGALAFASLKRNKPLIITVEENETVLNDSADKLGIEAVKVSNYWEAIGVVAAHKAGVNPNSLRRNKIKNIRQMLSVTSNGYAVSTAR